MPARRIKMNMSSQVTMFPFCGKRSNCLSASEMRGLPFAPRSKIDLEPLKRRGSRCAVEFNPPRLGRSSSHTLLFRYRTLPSAGVRHSRHGCLLHLRALRTSSSSASYTIWPKTERTIFFPKQSPVETFDLAANNSKPTLSSKPRP